MSRKSKRSQKKSQLSTPRKGVAKHTTSNLVSDDLLTSGSDAKFFRSSECFFLVMLLLWSFLVSCFPMRNMDIWWHLRTGQLILERGTVPYFDWFTFVDSERPWIDLHWGFQVLVTWLYRWGGVDLLILSKAFCLVLTIGFAWFSSGQFIPTWLKALLWILPVICISGRSLVRPEMLSLVYLALWMWILCRMDSRPRLIWLIPLITLLWVNCHALFVLGLVVSALYIVDHLLRIWGQGRYGLEMPSTAISGITFIRAGVLTVLACFLNPYLEQGVFFPLTLYEKFSVDQAFYSVRIGEFQPPINFILNNGFRNLYLVSQVILAGLTLISFFPLLMRKKVNPFRILLFVAFTHLGWKASRNTGVFSLIAGIILCGNISDWIWLAHSQSAAGRSGAEPKVSGAQFSLFPFNLSRFTKPGTVISASVFLFLLVSLYSGYWNRWGGEGKVLALGEKEAWYAHEAAKFAGQPGMPDRGFISNMGQAAVYIFHNGPERKVFFDGRLEVNSKETFQFYEQMKQQMVLGKADWTYLLQDEKGQLPVIILDSRYSRMEIGGMASNPGWRLVFADQAAAVFLDLKTAKRLELPEVDPSPLAYPPGMKVRK